MENNIKNDDEELFLTSLNIFLEKENGIKETKLFTELQKVPHVLYKYIPWINSGINVYNDSFNRYFAKLEPIIKQESQNCFSIRFIIQNKKFTYDFEELEKQISKLEGKSLDEYVCKKVNELNLYDFLDDYNYILDKEWSNDIVSNYCIMGFDIDEAIDDQNWKKESSVSLRFTSENDLDEIFNVIQIVGKEMECKNNELFAYSKNPATYLQMLKTGVCAVAVRNNRIIASLLTRPEDNRDGVFDLTGMSKEFMHNTIEFVTCQVLEEYRGNKLEQKLIDFVLTTLNKLACYKYVICTISPDNAASLKSVENNGFRVCNTAKLYGGKTRYVLMKELGMNTDEPTKKFENISGNALIKDLQNKYVFWDIDGTLAPYRFNNHVADPNGTNNGMSIQEIEKGIFLARKPSRHIQKVLSTCDAKENIVMGHCQVEKEIQDKQLWLDEHYPMIKERLLVYEYKSKADTILQYCKSHNINLDDVVYVDDVISFLREAERKGIKSYHISSFLDWEYQF